MPYIAIIFVLFLSFPAVSAFGAANATNAAPGADKENNPVLNALKQAQETAIAMPEHKDQAERPGESAPSAQDAENAGPEQAVYPGVRNRRLESGGHGEPSSTLWYPQLGNAAVDAALREFVEKAATGYENEVRESVAEGSEKPESWSQWEQSGFFTLTRPNPDVVSITFNIYNYTGGAHGQIYIIVLNYDLKTGKELTLADLFGDVPAALSIMSKVSATQLRKTLGEDTDEEMLTDGTEATETNFGALSLLPTGVSVEFQPYQVGPWSIGQQHVDITLEDLAPAKPSPRVWPPRN